MSLAWTCPKNVWRKITVKNFKLDTYCKNDKGETINKMERRHTWSYGRMCSISRRLGEQTVGDWVLKDYAIHHRTTAYTHKCTCAHLCTCVSTTLYFTWIFHLSFSGPYYDSALCFTFRRPLRIFYLWWHTSFLDSSSEWLCLIAQCILASMQTTPWPLQHIDHCVLMGEASDRNIMSALWQN
jgi:hypothetical protein